MPRVIINVPYSSLFDHTPTIGQVLHKFAEYNKIDTVQLLAHLNYIHSRDDDTVTPQACNYMLCESTKRLVARYASNHQAEYRPFFKQQLLTALKAALLYCDDSSGKYPQSDAIARFDLGELLLGITDILPSPTEFSDQLDLIENPQFVIRSFDVSISIENEPVYDLHLHRYWKLLEEFVPHALEENRLPRNLWNTRFFEAYGCEIADVFMLVHLMYLYFAGARLQSSPPRPFMERATFFAYVNWSPERLNKVLEHISASWEDYPTKLFSEHSLPFTADFTTFRNKPLIASKAGFQIIDLQFLMGLFGGQMLSQIRKSFPIRRQQFDFNSILGKAFERYTVWFLRQAYPLPTDGLVDRIREIPPISGSGEKVPDLEVIDYPASTLFEFKGMLFSDHAVYGGDPQLFGSELYRSYAQSEGTGVAQLAKYIARLQKNNAPDAPERIHPVLVGHDKALSALATQFTLNNAFERALTASKGATAGRKPSVSKLTVLTIEDLERLVISIGGGGRLSDMIDTLQTNSNNGVVPAQTTISEALPMAETMPSFLQEAVDDTKVRWESLLTDGINATVEAAGREPNSETAVTRFDCEIDA